jgi:4-hydroxybenzoyl-CoA thioesterase
MSKFARSYKVRFDECDMAGIVFFPNYLIMFNHLFEDWFSDELRIPLGDYHSERKSGLPLLNLKVSFQKPSRVGDVLAWELEVRKLGVKSLILGARASCQGEERIEIETTMVAVNLVPDGIVSQEIPADIRAAMERFLVVPSQP